MFNILIIDDETSVRHSLSNTLRDEGYKIFLARSGKEAIRKQLTTPSEVILLDMRLPHMEGPEIYERINKIDTHTTFIGVTAFSNDYKPLMSSVKYWVDKPILSKKKKMMLRGIVRQAISDSLSNILDNALSFSMKTLKRSTNMAIDKFVNIINTYYDSGKLEEIFKEHHIFAISQFALLYSTIESIKQSKINIRDFSRVFFSEVGNSEEIVKALREIRIATLAQNYESDIKKYNKFLQILEVMQ